MCMLWFWKLENDSLHMCLCIFLRLKCIKTTFCLWRALFSDVPFHLVSKCANVNLVIIWVYKNKELYVVISSDTVKFWVSVCLGHKKVSTSMMSWLTLISHMVVKWGITLNSFMRLWLTFSGVTTGSPELAGKELVLAAARGICSW